MLCSVPIQTGPIINEANGHTYYLLEASTWTEAEATAMELGGNLVTITDAAEDAWVRETFGDSNQFGLWTGLNDQQTEGEFVWTSGEPVTYTNWASGQPDNHNGEEDFVMLYTDAGGRWADYSDRATTAGRPLQGVVEIPTFVNPANGHTYIKLSPSTWTEAQARAEELGGHLVTINNAAEQEWVFDTFSDVSQFGLWIGLTDRWTEGRFRWSSGQALTYTNWGEGQPDNHGGQENYVMMLIEDGGVWYDYRGVAYVGGNSHLPLHGIVEYEGIKHSRTGQTIPGTELVPPGPCLNLDGWNLQHAALYRRNLRGSSFVGADLSDASFVDATLADADLTNAIITGTNFASTTQKGFVPQQLYSTASYQMKALRGVSLATNELRGWNFRGQDLAHARLFRSNLQNADFSGANLTSATLSDSYLSRANLSHANLTNTSLQDASLAHADMTDAVIGGANLARTTAKGLTADQLYATASYRNKNLKGVDLSWNVLTDWDFNGQDLSNGSLSSSTLRHANFDEAIIAGVSFSSTTDKGFRSDQLYSTASYQSNEIPRVSFAGNDLAGWSFSGQDLSYASFSHANLTNTDFTEAIIRGANLRRATSNGFTESDLYSTSSYSRNDLAAINFANNELSGWDLHGQNLSNVLLYGSDLSDADLSGAKLTNAEGRGINLVGANLSRANLTGMKLGWSDLSMADLTGANLTRAVLDGANLHGVDMTGAIIEGADLRRTTQAGFTAEQLYSTSSYQNRNLSGIQLRHNDLQGWNLQEQNFQGADLYSANLTNANLSQTDLTEASLKFAILSDADVTGATILGTDLSYTIERGFTSGQLYSTFSYQGQDLSGLNMGHNNLRNFDFHQQKLVGSQFDFSNLTNVTFASSDLTQASLWGATLVNANLASARAIRSNMTAANLTGANLMDTDLTGATARDAVGFDPIQSTIVRNVIWPDNRLRPLSLENHEEFDFPHPSIGSAEYYPEIAELFNVGVDEMFAMQGNSILDLQLITYLHPVTAEQTPTIHSRVEVASDAAVSLDGTLRIRQVGPNLWYSSYDLFDWPENVQPTTAFSRIEIPAGNWDLSSLYTTGEVRRTARYQYDGDFDVDGVLSDADIDRLAISLRGGRDASYDVNDDQTLTETDHLAWVEDIAGTRLGDANLDQAIDFSDFLNLSRHFGESGGWAKGDFNADGEIDFADFLLLSQNYGWEVSDASEASGQLAAAHTPEETTRNVDRMNRRSRSVR